MINLSPRTLRVAGGALLIVGLQAWGFHHSVASQVERTSENLSALLEELPSNAGLNRALKLLRDIRRASADLDQNREVLALREFIVTEFREHPGDTLDEALRVASDFDGASEREVELIAALRVQLQHLRDMYSRANEDAVSAYLDAPFYLQPTAAFLAMTGTTRDRIELNEAMYLTLSGKREMAMPIFDELRRDTHSDEIRSRALFMLARLYFDSFRETGADDHFRQSREYTQQSLKLDSQQGLPKLFLEYLLSFDSQAMEIESAPEEGQGTGESQGERGSISSGPREH